MQCEKFKAFLERVRKRCAAQDDAAKLVNPHHIFYRHSQDFKQNIEDHNKTMWLFSNNADVRKKNVDKLVKTAKSRKVPVARLNCWYDTNKTQNGKERHTYLSHFDSNCYKSQTDLCVGARVALRNWNILPCAGLYNGSIGTIIDIVYKNDPPGPNDKQHNHLPDYVVVDFPHLTLPSYIEPWDRLHPTVNAMTTVSMTLLIW